MNTKLRGLLWWVLGFGLGVGALYLYQSHLISPPSSEIEVEGIDSLEEREGQEVLVTNLSGEVYVIRSGEITALELGDTLGENDIIKVVDDAFCQIQFVDQATVKVKENSLLQVFQWLSLTNRMEVKTKLLIGSLIYKVSELGKEESLHVESDGIVYGVEGTDFLIEKGPGQEGTRLAVLSGQVVATGLKDGRQHVIGAGKELFLKKGSLPIIDSLSDTSRMKLTEGVPMTIFGPPSESPPLVKVTLTTVPYGATIYQDGVIVGQGSFEALFPAGQEKEFLLRKRGYREKSIALTMKQGEDKAYTIHLRPEDLEGSLAPDRQDNREEAFEQRLSRERGLYEQKLENQDKTHQMTLEAMEKQITSLEEEIQTATAAEKDFSARLLEARQKSERLEQRLGQMEDRAKSLESEVREEKKKKDDIEREKREVEQALSISRREEKRLRELIQKIDDLTEEPSS